MDYHKLLLAVEDIITLPEAGVAPEVIIPIINIEVEGTEYQLQVNLSTENHFTTGTVQFNPNGRLDDTAKEEVQEADIFDSFRPEEKVLIAAEALITDDQLGFASEILYPIDEVEINNMQYHLQLRITCIPEHMSKAA